MLIQIGKKRKSYGGPIGSGGGGEEEFDPPNITSHDFSDSTYGPSATNAGGDEFFTTDFGHSGDICVGIDYVGNGDVDQGGGIVISFDPSLTTSRYKMYSRWYVRYQSPFTGLENIQKLTRYREIGFASIMGTLTFHGAAGIPAFTWSWDEGPDIYWQVPTSTYNIYEHLDEWLCWETYNDITPGNYEFKFWNNGVLLIDTLTQASTVGGHVSGPVDLDNYGNTPFSAQTLGGTFNTLLGRGRQFWADYALSDFRIGPLAA